MVFQDYVKLYEELYAHAFGKPPMRIPYTEYLKLVCFLGVTTESVLRLAFKDQHMIKNPDKIIHNLRDNRTFWKNKAIQQQYKGKVISAKEVKRLVPEMDQKHKSYYHKDFYKRSYKAIRNFDKNTAVLAAKRCPKHIAEQMKNAYKNYVAASDDSEGHKS